MNQFKYRSIVAATIVAGAGLLNCGSAGALTFEGGTFNVSASLVGGKQADFVYSVDFNNPGPWTGWDYISAIDFGLSGYTVVTIDSFSTTASGNWITKLGPSNSNGCNNVSGAFACAEDNPFSEATGQQTTGAYVWNFRVTFDKNVNAADFLSTENHIGAFGQRCETKQGVRVCKGGVGLSETTPFTSSSSSSSTSGGEGSTSSTSGTTVPEPSSSLVLLGLGLIGLGFARRMKAAA